MERNFYNDDFERLLKEKSDEFTMQPSRRVWRSVYNNFHPSRKWPSIAISLILIGIMVWIGYENSGSNTPVTAAGKNNNGQGESNGNNIAQIQQPQNSSIEKSNTAAAVPGTNIPSQANSNPGNGPANTSINSNTNSANNTDLASQHNPALTVSAVRTNQYRTGNLRNHVTGSATNNTEAALSVSVIKNNIPAASGNAAIAIGNNSEIVNTPAEESITTSSNKKEVAADEKNVDVNSTSENSNATLTADQKLSDNSVSATENKKDNENTNTKNVVATNSISATISVQDKAWMEAYAFHNKRNGGKWKDRMSYEIYFTPGVSYRTLKNNTPYAGYTAASVASNQGSSNINDQVTQTPSLGAEFGAALIYTFSKRWKFKGGLQFNYNSYNIKAFETNHPVQTSLMLNDLNTGYPYLESRISTLSNIAGTSVNVNNKTFQISAPLGLEYKLAGKDNIQWYAGATIQPTYVLGGKTYLISADRKNYVEDNSLLRKWSINAGFESFVSYKTPNGFTLQVGPQFRLQLPSTYSKLYTLNEKVFTAGLKVGIVRNF